MITSHRPHQQPHINPLPLIVLGVLILAVLAVLTFVQEPIRTIDSDMEKVTQDTRPRFAYPAAGVEEYPAYYQSEWGKPVSPAIRAKGIEQYHLSERTLIPANAGMTQYQLSERSMIPAQAGFAQYQASERTYVPYVSGLDQYHASERTPVVIRLDPNDPLYLYHLSEWYGK